MRSPIGFAQSDWSMQQSGSKVYLAVADEHDRPLSLAKTSFDCSEKIFAVAELKGFPKGKHEFSVRWIDPADTTREHTRYPFHVTQDSTRLWSWLSLKRGAGAGMLQWLDPSAGLEEFIGPWTVEIEVDGKRLESLTMEVNC
jgi:hypothetical protein